MDRAEVWLRGATPGPTSGAATESARLRQHRSGREELPHVWGQRRQPRGATPHPRSGAVAETSYPMPEVRGHGRDELPHVRGQGWWPRWATPRPKNGGCVGAGGPRGAIPHSRSGGAVVRRYPSPKVRSSGCTLLEQLWRNTPRPM